MRYHERIRRLGLAVIMTGLASLAGQRAAQATPLPPEIPSSDYSWNQTSYQFLGLQSDGLNLWEFNFSMENTGSTPLRNIFDIIPPDPAISFGITSPTWNPSTKEWAATTAIGFTEVKPYNAAGFFDPATPQYPMFFVSSYIGVGQTASNIHLQFEITPGVGQFWFDGHLSSVPEPPTVALIGVGLVVLGFASRLRRRNSH